MYGFRPSRFWWAWSSNAVRESEQVEPSGAIRVLEDEVGLRALHRGGLHVHETTTHHYRFHNQTGRRTIALDARLDDGTVRGTVTAVEHFDEPGYGPYVCESGPIRFAARAQR